MALSRISKRLPSSLRNNFWISLVDSVKDEIDLMHENASEKKYVYSFREADLQQLIELGSVIYNVPIEFLELLTQSLQYSYLVPESVVEEFLREELMKTPFFIQNKGTLTLYKSLFNFYISSYTNEISVYKTTTDVNPYTGIQVILRDLKLPIFSGIEDSYTEYSFIDDEETLLEDPYSIIGYDDVYSSIFTQEMTGDFTGQREVIDTLDSGETLDTGLILDTTEEQFKNPTKHISLEFVSDFLQGKIFQDPITEATYWRNFTITSELLGYVFSGTELYRRAVEVPHIGLQMTILLDNSGIWDAHTTDETYTIPELQLKGVIDPDVLAEVPLEDGMFIRFGIGEQELPSSTNGLSFPSDVDSAIASKFVHDQEKINNDSFVGGIGEYIGQEIALIPIPSIIFDGSTTEFSDSDFFSDNFIAPVKKNTIKMAIVNTLNPTIESYLIEDDGFGNLISEVCAGTINYGTGAFSFDTSFQKKKSSTETFPSGTSITKSFFNDVIAGSLYMSFQYTESEIVNYYYVKDNGDGTIETNFPYIDTGTSSITYTEAPNITLEFTEELQLTDVTTIYKWLKTTYFLSDGVSKQWVVFIYDLYTQNPTIITEAGLFVRTVSNSTVDQMLAYITFAPAEISLSRFHMNLAIIVEK